MSHGIKILELMRANMRELGRKPSDVESAAIIDQYITVQSIKMKKVRKAGMPTVHKRDAIFDLLAICDGQTGTLTRHAGARIASAKKQILEVMTEASTEQVTAEITKRWARYCRKYTEKRMQTAMALVAHWGEFGDADVTDRRRTRAEQMNIYIEPAGDWRLVMSVVCKIKLEVLADKKWDEMGVDYRAATLADIVKHGPK